MRAACGGGRQNERGDTSRSDRDQFPRVLYAWTPLIISALSTVAASFDGGLCAALPLLLI